MTPLEKLGIDWPIIQAPMAGVSTPTMAAAVSNAGALGSIGVGATNAKGAQEMIAAFRERSERSLNVNVFCHRPPASNPTRESEWIARLRPHFEKFGAAAPLQLTEIYQTFLVDDSMLKLLVSARPRIVSFHFGLPSAERLRTLREAGIVLIASATSLAEGQAAASAGVDAVVAQGYEAGGHRGVFDPDAADDCLGVVALTRILVRELRIPVIAAGGIMDGAGISAMLRLGAVAAQLGTAFVGCRESDADRGYRAALTSDSANHTVMTRAISGRPARCLPNQFTRLGAEATQEAIPAYPIAYDAGKKLNAAAKAAGDFGYGAQWAGQAAPLARSLPAAELIAALIEELQ
ncbi:MAG: Nitronate monooxygenase [Gammaproteobacteria bacterium]|nr:Nitronate monooxygenase [Gammaproteobacteria bacterium]